MPCSLVLKFEVHMHVVQSVGSVQLQGCTENGFLKKDIYEKT
jgi:hypothetical protein